MRRGAWTSLVLVMGCGRSNFDHLGDAFGDTAATPCRITQISAAESHACALFADHTAQCWGLNLYGGLGDGTTMMSSMPVRVLESSGGPAFTNIERLSLGVGNASCAVRIDHTAWCWGDNREGQNGDGTLMPHATPVQVMASPGVPLANVVEVAAGEDSVCARTADRRVWCWGNNMYGQIGNLAAGARTLMPLQVVDSISEPIAVDGVMTSVQHACAWTGSGQLSCWGRGEGGRLGYGGTTDQAAPMGVALPNVQRATSAYRHTCALVTGGGLFCWGYDTTGELGDAGGGTQLSPVAVHGPGNVGTFGSAIDVGAGDYGTCAARMDGTVWCWGSNTSGRLGNGTPGDSSIPVQAALPIQAGSIAVGNRFTCALSADGLEVWCWGYGLNGEMGNGQFIDSAVPVKALVGCPAQ